jgi:type IV secretory pathway protease TraF
MTPIPRPVAWAFAGLLAAGTADATLRERLAGRPPLIINESSSVPRGVYVRSTAPAIARGALVTTPPPAGVRPYLDALGVRPGARLLKRVVATHGDRVCAIEGYVVAADRRVPVFSADRTGRLLPRWRGCRPLRAGEVFLLGDAPQSFDSRYFGPVTVVDLEGAYREVLTW